MPTPMTNVMDWLETASPFARTSVLVRVRLNPQGFPTEVRYMGTQPKYRGVSIYHGTEGTHTFYREAVRNACAHPMMVLYNILSRVGTSELATQALKEGRGYFRFERVSEYLNVSFEIQD